MSANVIIRPFIEDDAASAAELLSAASPNYVRFFRPFKFERDVVQRLVRAARKDRWFAIEIARDEEPANFAGFYMLRGPDEGFADPMYGIFIAEEFSGLGLARLSLAHAGTICRLNRWQNLLLKVDPANTRAFELYQTSGFRFLRLDHVTGNQVMIKPLAAATPRSALSP